jgi:FkbM family methyltransferase
MKTMIYAGVNKGEGFFPKVSDFDQSLGFEANPKLYRALQKRLDIENFRNVEIINAALCDFDGEVMFNINNDNYTSSIGMINNDVHPSIKTINAIKVKALNLYYFLKAQNIDYIDFYLSDLQGMDLAVLGTLKPFLDEKKIEVLQCEVGKDDRPSVYVGLYNKFSGFQDILSDNYEIIDHRKVEEDFTEDIVWRVKQ